MARSICFHYIDYCGVFFAASCHWFVGFLFPVVLQVRMAVFNQHHVDGLDLTVNPLLYMMRCYPVSSSVISGYCRIYESSPGGYLRWIFSTQYLSQISTLGLIQEKCIWCCLQGVPEQKLRSHLGSFGVSGNLALQPMYTLSGRHHSHRIGGFRWYRNIW